MSQRRLPDSHATSLVALGVLQLLAAALRHSAGELILRLRFSFGFLLAEIGLGALQPWPLAVVIDYVLARQPIPQELWSELDAVGYDVDSVRLEPKEVERAGAHELARRDHRVGALRSAIVCTPAEQASRAGEELG